MWSCLCGYDQYLQRVSECAKNACNQADYDSEYGLVRRGTSLTWMPETIIALADLCGITGDKPTIAPYATASTGTEDQIFSTVALSTSLPPVISATTDTSGSAMDSESTSATRVSQDIAGTSISTITSSGALAEATASPTTTNIAQRLDIKSTALHGMMLALLGLAVYL